MPFPREETTPPVTNTNLVMGDRFRKSRILPEARRRQSRRHGVGTVGSAHAATAVSAARRPRADADGPLGPGRRARRRGARPPSSRASNASTASIAGVSRVPATSTRIGIITCGGFRPWRAAAALSAAPMRFARPLERRELACSSCSAGRLASSSVLRERSGDRMRRGVEIVRGVGHFGQRGDAVAQQRRDRLRAPDPSAGSRPARARYGTRRRPSSSSSRRFICSSLTQRSLSGSKRPGDEDRPARSNQAEKLLAAEDLVVAVRPAEPREVVDAPPPAGSRRRGTAARPSHRGAWTASRPRASAPSAGARTPAACRPAPGMMLICRGVLLTWSSPRITCVMSHVEVVDDHAEVVGRRAVRSGPAPGRRARRWSISIRPLTASSQTTLPASGFLKRITGSTPAGGVRPRAFSGRQRPS